MGFNSGFKGLKITGLKVEKFFCIRACIATSDNFENNFYHNSSDVITNFAAFDPLNAELSPICHLPALLGAHHILHVSRMRVNYFVSYSIHHIHIYD